MGGWAATRDTLDGEIDRQDLYDTLEKALIPGESTFKSQPPFLEIVAVCPSHHCDEAISRADLHDTYVLVEERQLGIVVFAFPHMQACPPRTSPLHADDEASHQVHDSSEASLAVSLAERLKDSSSGQSRDSIRLIHA